MYIYYIYIYVSRTANERCLRFTLLRSSFDTKGALSFRCEAQAPLARLTEQLERHLPLMVLGAGVHHLPSKWSYPIGCNIYMSTNFNCVKRLDTINHILYDILYTI